MEKFTVYLNDGSRPRCFYSEESLRKFIQRCEAEGRKGYIIANTWSTLTPQLKFRTEDGKIFSLCEAPEGVGLILCAFGEI